LVALAGILGAGAAIGAAASGTVASSACLGLAVDFLVLTNTTFCPQATGARNDETEKGLTHQATSPSTRVGRKLCGRTFGVQSLRRGRGAQAWVIHPSLVREQLAGPEVLLSHLRNRVFYLKFERRADF